MKIAAGTLLYKSNGAQLEVLLVHPSGNYNRKAPWSIPKGEPNPDEPAASDHERVARRETLEETGVTAGPLVPLGHIDYRKSRKRIFCFAGPAEDAQPAVASWEVDQAAFVPLGKARQLIHPDQLPFLDRLLELLK